MGRRLLVTAALVAAAAQPAQASTDLAQMKALLEQLATRVQALEARNSELEKALETERLSEREPEIATRLKALEARTQAMDAPVKRMDALEGIQVEGSITAVGQPRVLGARPLASVSGEPTTVGMWRSRSPGGLGAT